MFIVAVWRGMKAHELIALRLEKIVELLQSKGK